MTLRAPRRVNIKKIEDAERAFNNLVLSLSRVFKSEIVDGALVSEVSLEAGSNIISHTLGRQPLGWIIVDVVGGNPSIYRESWDSRVLRLNCNISTTISLWVF